MNLEYFVFYLEASVVCIVIFAIVLFNDLKHSTRDEKQIWYDRTIVAHMLYFVSDIGWAAIIGGVLPRSRVLLILFNCTNYALLSLIAYAWFMFMAASEKLPFRRERRKRMLILLPMIISFLALVLVLLIRPGVLISAEGEVLPLYNLMFVSTPLCYILGAFGTSLANARKAESQEDRKKFLLIGVYPLTVVFFGLVQTFTVNAPLFCCGCTVMMLHFYIQNMQTMISLDPLTKLNNRGQIDRYIEHARYRQNVRQYAVMMDINRFKQINDTYGHAEGDRALILTAETLKETVATMKTPAFLGRYGGDEFTLFLQFEKDEGQIDRLADSIREKLEARQKQNALLYDLTVSLGYDLLRDEKDTMEECLARADEKLYQEKRRIGSLR